MQNISTFMQSILGNTRKADIAFRRSGRIDISARVAAQLNLQSGDVIDIAESGGEYYLYIHHHAPAVGHHEATVYNTNKRGKHFRTHSVRLCRALLSVSGSGRNIVRLCVGEPQLHNLGTILPIITKLPL